jgi:hypothetical protein
MPASLSEAFFSPFHKSDYKENSVNTTMDSLKSIKNPDYKTTKESQSKSYKDFVDFNTNYDIKNYPSKEISEKEIVQFNKPLMNQFNEQINKKTHQTSTQLMDDTMSVHSYTDNTSINVDDDIHTLKNCESSIYHIISCPTCLPKLKKLLAKNDVIYEENSKNIIEKFVSNVSNKELLLEIVYYIIWTIIILFIIDRLR